MADDHVQAESVSAKPIASLYNDYRRAKAAWDLVLYRDDYQDDSDDAESKAHTAALKSFLLAPSEDVRDLVKKLRVFGDEEAFDYDFGRDALRVLYVDAHRLAYPGVLD